MRFRRRSVLLGASSSAMLVRSAALAAAPDSNTQTFSNQFGLPSLNAAPSDLQLLLQAQESATAVPSSQPGFTQYVTNSPIIQAIQSGRNLDYYHLLAWHSLILDLTALDHTTIAGSTDPTFGEQYGPPRTSRAFAIFHLALFEAVNAIYRTHPSYRNLQAQILAQAGASPSATTPATASVVLAIAYAAKGVLDVLYRNKSSLTQVVFDVLVTLAPPASASARDLGVAIGQATAGVVLAARQYDPRTAAFGDGSGDVAGAQSLSIEPTYQVLQAQGLLPANPGPLDWVPDPIVPNQVALGGYWSRVTPFVLAELPLIVPFPAVQTPQFQATYLDVRLQGGDPNPPQLGSRHPTGTTRTGTQPGAPLVTSNQTFTSTFWGYDGTALLCAPPRLYNMVATSVALNERPVTNTDDMAYYLALINIAMFEAGLAGWANKYHYHFARPVSYIRAIEPTQSLLGTPNSQWTPKGSPDTNGPSSHSNFTPPFPAYPSGHATYGGALFQTMRRYFNTAQTGEPSFQFVSDEYNGRNRDAFGNIRPYVQRLFPSFTFAETENARSRVWDGVHWQVDSDQGIALGNRVADYVFDNAFRA